jgi:MFS family permease
VGDGINIPYYDQKQIEEAPALSMMDTDHISQDESPDLYSGRLRRQNTFAALKYPNYRLWFTGQIISLFGTWMQTTAQGFLVYTLTQSPAYLGYVGFASGAPGLVLMLYGGVIADRVPRRVLLIVTQTSMMIFAFILAALTFLNIVQPWHIVLLSFLLGVANAFDAPARQAFVSEMVASEDLTNAIALNATMFNTALAVGPGVAGVTYAAFGPGWCFTINGLSFIAVIIALWRMKVQTTGSQAKRESVVRELMEGLRHVAGNQVIKILFVVIAVNQLFVFSLNTLVPAWSVSVLQGDATTNGFLYSFRGLGSLAGALGIASLGRFSFRGKVLTFGAFLSSALMIVFAFSHWLPISLLLMVGIGVGAIMVMNLANAMVQTMTPDRLRGRVMGAYTWIFFGSMPLGALWVGSLAERTSLPGALVIDGMLGLVAAVIVWRFFPKLREQ